jgi:hypothetical protein
MGGGLGGVPRHFTISVINLASIERTSMEVQKLTESARGVTSQTYLSFKPSSARAVRRISG